jgi:hypothetical protein
MIDLIIKNLSENIKIMMFGAKLIVPFETSDIAFSVGLYMAVGSFAITFKSLGIIGGFPSKILSIFFSSLCINISYSNKAWPWDVVSSFIFFLQNL